MSCGEPRKHPELFETGVYYQDNFIDGRPDYPSALYTEPGSDRRIRIEFHKPNEVFDDYYAVVILSDSSTSRLAVRIPQSIFNVVYHYGWVDRHEPCVSCGPEEIYMDGEITKEEFTERYGENGERIPYCKECRESDWYNEKDK